MSIFIVTFAFTLAISSKWAYSYFGLSSFEQIVYHIKVPLEGTNTQFISDKQWHFWKLVFYVSLVLLILMLATQIIAWVPYQSVYHVINVA